MKPPYTLLILLIISSCAHSWAQNTSTVSDTLIIKGNSIGILSESNKIESIKFLQGKPKRIVLMSSVKSDSILFSLVNGYREQSGLKPLIYSLRLDTLSKKVLYWLHFDDETRHYSTMEEMKPFRDLMNLENIAYIHSLSNESCKFDPQQILEGWIKSPPHNKTMLADLHVGSASSLAKLTMLNEKLVIEIFSIFECDHTVSKRELTHRYDSLNKKLIQRPIKFQKRKN